MTLGRSASLSSPRTRTDVITRASKSDGGYHRAVTDNRTIWRDAFDASTLREGRFTTMSGIPLEPVYGTDDGEFPGVYPYTRGPYASMYRSRLWTMRMFAGFGTADDTNWRFKEIIKSGGDGLSTAFDMPTLLGLDSDDPMSLGEVGRCGVAVDSLELAPLHESMLWDYLERTAHAMVNTFED